MDHKLRIYNVNEGKLQQTIEAGPGRIVEMFARVILD
jgi:hypothetical protein